MATQTPLRHPDENKQLGQFYPYTVSITQMNPDGSQGTPLELPCAYDAGTGGTVMPEEFQDEAPAMDRILIQGWHSSIATKQTAVVIIGGVRKRFEIADVLPQGMGADNRPAATLLLVMPKDT